MSDTMTRIFDILAVFATFGAWAALRGLVRFVRATRAEAKAHGWSKTLQRLCAKYMYDEEDKAQKHKSGSRAPEAAYTLIDKEEALRCLETALERMQIHFQRIDKGEDGEPPSYCFEYQNGSFVLNAAPLTQSIIMPYVYSAELAEADCVRIACNELNAVSHLVTAYYNIDEDEENGKTEIRCHLSASVAYTTDVAQITRDLHTAFRSLFAAREKLGQDAAYIVERSAEHHVSDIELDHYSEKFLSSVLDSEEAMHSLPKDGFLSFGEAPREEKHGDTLFCERLSVPTIGDWLREMGLLTGAQLLRLRIVTGESVQVIEDEKEIEGYDLTCALTSQDIPYEEDNEDYDKEKAGGAGTRTATLLLSYHLPGDAPEEVRYARQLTLLIEEDGSNTGPGEYIRYRLTYTLPRKEVRAPYTGAAVKESARPLCGTMTLSGDMHLTTRLAAEFRYKLAEAMEASRKGEPLTDEQREMVATDNPNDSYDIFWGNRLLQRGDYFNAALHFQRCWHRVNRRPPEKRDRRTRRFFCDLSYRTGLCLNRLGLHRSAYFYLKACEGTEDPDHLMELINCLTDAKDYRAVETVEEVIAPLEKRIRQCEDDGDDIPPSFTRLHNFLRRRRVYLRIEYGQTEQAERDCHAMLDEPENADFALGELARIQKLREESEEKGGEDGKGKEA